MSRAYTIDGLKLPSVTTVLDILDKGVGLQKWIANLGWEESRRIFKASGERGGRVHKYIQGVLVGSQTDIIATQESLEEPDTPYANGFNGFYNNVLQRLTIEKQESEKTVACKTCGYAGTLDWMVWFRRFQRPRRVALVDWKTSSKIRDEVAIQTAAYLHAYFTSKGASCKRADRLAQKVERWCVRLTEDSTYQVRRYRDYTADFACFKALLVVYKWKHYEKENEA